VSEDEGRRGQAGGGAEEGWPLLAYSIQLSDRELAVAVAVLGGSLLMEAVVEEMLLRPGPPCLAALVPSCILSPRAVHRE